MERRPVGTRMDRLEASRGGSTPSDLAAELGAPGRTLAERERRLREGELALAAAEGAYQAEAEARLRQLIRRGKLLKKRWRLVVAGQVWVALAFLGQVWWFYWR
jgi:hypothetical protein